MWNNFKVNDKDTRKTSMTSFWPLYCYFWTYFIHFSTVSTVDFEPVNIYWDISRKFQRTLSWILLYWDYNLKRNQITWHELKLFGQLINKIRSNEILLPPPIFFCKLKLRSFNYITSLYLILAICYINFSANFILCNVFRHLICLCACLWEVASFSRG